MLTKGGAVYQGIGIILCNVEGIEPLPVLLITNVSNYFPGSKTYGY
jgi:hypothetical protein